MVGGDVGADSLRRIFERFFDQSLNKKNVLQVIKIGKEEHIVGGNVKTSIWYKLFNVTAYDWDPSPLGPIFSPRGYNFKDMLYLYYTSRILKH